MDHFVRTLFWMCMISVMYCNSKPIDKMSGSEIIRRIRMMKTDVKCENDSNFYSPKNVEDKCITSALKCYFQEIYGTVKLECEAKGQIIGQVASLLDKIIEEHKKNEDTNVPAESDECACETWTEVPFQQFIDEFESLIQKINAKS